MPVAPVGEKGRGDTFPTYPCCPALIFDCYRLVYSTENISRHNDTSYTRQQKTGVGLARTCPERPRFVHRRAGPLRFPTGLGKSHRRDHSHLEPASAPAA